jgi:threonine synthase
MKTRAIGGEYLRVAKPDWVNPVDASYAQESGGRWNPPGTYATLYLNCDIATARAFVRHNLRELPYGPEDLSPIDGPHLVRVRGHYDDVNRLCAQVADRFGWGIVNVNLRGYYGEGSKTMAFEIAEQVGWQLPTAVVAPMAGGSLVTKLRKGFREFLDAGLVSGEPPKIFGAQASGCAPIVRLLERGGETVIPEVPATIARSIAIGNPADGVFAARAMRESGGWAAAVTDEELVSAIRLLAETTGIFAETAGGVTVAGALALAAAGRLGAEDSVVLCITGNGLKTADAVEPVLTPAPVIAPKVREVAALVERAW